MSMTIVGAGAIGGTLGAYMARAGEDVVLVDRDREHVEAMQRAGLTIEAFDETFTVPVTARTVDVLSGPLDTVLLAVKSQHTMEALRPLIPLFTPDATVVSCQNGLCEQVIASEIGPERTVGCFVNFSADYLQPGRIAYGGPGAVYLGELDGRDTPRLHRLQSAMSAWGDVRRTDNIWGYLWGKLGYANMLFATALADETMADVIDRYRPLMIELATEMYEVADREGVRPEPFDCVEPALYYPRENRDPEAIQRSLDDLVARRRQDLKTKSGVWRDLAVRRRKTEVDQQLGLAAAIGSRHGLSMRLTHAVVRMIHEIEDGRRQMSRSNLDELASLQKDV